MMEWVLILALWTGETVIYDTWQNQKGCGERVSSLINQDRYDKDYGPSRYMNIYCEAVNPGEPIIEYWKICSYRDGCWGPDTVNWSSIAPTRPGWYLHRYRSRVMAYDGRVMDMARLLKIEEVNGRLLIMDTGATWTTVLPYYPVASLGGEWTQDALVMRDKVHP